MASEFGTAVEARYPLFNPPASPDNERLNMTARRYIQQFLTLPRPGRYSPLMLNSRPGSPVAIELHKVDLNPHTSTVYRSAILVLMSHLKKSHPSDTSGYFAKYMQEAQQCIDATSFEEVVYSSYLVTIYSISGGKSVQTAINFCRQFCQSVVELTRKRRVADDWIELIWQNLLASLYYVHRDTILFNYSKSTLMESAAQWEKLLDTSYGLLVNEADIADLPLSMTTEKICHKLTSLCVYMQLYLDQFLTRVGHAEYGSNELELARGRLCSIADRIMRLVSHLSSISDYVHHAYQIEVGSANSVNNGPNSTFLYFADLEPRGLMPNAPPDSRDTAVALLYAFARLLKNLLKPAAEIEENTPWAEPYRSAIAIARISATLPIEGFMETLLVKRSLFWSGVVLTESTFPEGLSLLDLILTGVANVWIRDRLHDCISRDHHWYPDTIFKNEEELVNEFFRKADVCTTCHELWRINACEIPLFYYANTLATWYFGLNLVRFVDKPNSGRIMRIS